MKKICILCDFDGTITQKDGLYTFFSKYANENWLKIEKDWENNNINSKECLQLEFEAVADLNEKLIKDYLKTVAIDEYFREFIQIIKKKKFDFYIVSDGLDYFINNILSQYNIYDVPVISNHLEFIDKNFVLKFPNEYKLCKKSAGTCKCRVLNQKKKEYEIIIYIGDGTSDFCVCNKADILFAKGKLYDYCMQNKIKCTEFKTFNDIIKSLKFNTYFF